MKQPFLYANLSFSVMAERKPACCGLIATRVEGIPQDISEYIKC